MGPFVLRRSSPCTGLITIPRAVGRGAARFFPARRAIPGILEEGEFLRTARNVRRTNLDDAAAPDRGP
jgi:hypothetical protein